MKPDTAEMAALPSSLGGLAPDEGEAEPPPRPWLRRPVVVVPLFALVMLAIVAGFAWPRPSAEELWTAAVPLVNSDNPADWDRAWDDYLEPLARKYPEERAAEVAAAKGRIRERKELLRAIEDGAKVGERSNAERGYRHGLLLAQAGEADAARRVWNAVVTAFGPVESERRWVDLSRAGLSVLDRNPGRGNAPVDRRAFEAAVDHARELSAAGRTSEAGEVFRALEELARDDPVAAAKLRNVKNGK